MHVCVTPLLHPTIITPSYSPPPPHPPAHNNQPHRLPTLYLAECVLIYLEPSEAEAVLATTAALAAEAGAPAAIAIYEQTRPDDAFGSTMIHNLEVGTLESV